MEQSTRECDCDSIRNKLVRSIRNQIFYCLNKQYAEKICSNYEVYSLKPSTVRIYQPLHCCLMYETALDCLTFTLLYSLVLSSVTMNTYIEYWWNDIQEKIPKYSRKIFLQVALSPPPRISHGLTLDRTRSSAEGIRRLIV